MLESLSLRNFKSFAEPAQSIPFAPFTLLVGVNASGKSNVLDALRFLQAIGHGWTIPGALNGHVEGGHRVWPGIRGGSHGATRKGATAFSVESRWWAVGDMFHHMIESDGDRILAESIGNLFTARDAGESAPGKLLVEWHQPLGSSATQLVSAYQSVMSCPGSPASAWVSMHTATLTRTLRVMDFDPASMRGYSPKPGGQPELLADGSNLSAVLWSLCQRDSERTAIVDWVSEMCAPEVTEIGFVITDADDVMLKVRERDGTEMTAKELSDGTLKFLALVTALRTATAGSILVFEDIDEGLHPTRLDTLVDLIESTTRPGTELLGTPMQSRATPQVIATTHNPQLLLRASDEVLGDTLLIARRPHSAGSTAHRLRELPTFDEIRKRRGIDHLFESGWLERAV